MDNGSFIKSTFKIKYLFLLENNKHFSWRSLYCVEKNVPDFLFCFCGLKRPVWVKSAHRRRKVALNDILIFHKKAICPGQGQARAAVLPCRSPLFCSHTLIKYLCIVSGIPLECHESFVYCCWLHCFGRFIFEFKASHY